MQMVSPDGTNRLASEFLISFTQVIQALAATMTPLVITGNKKFFSAGADLNELAALGGPTAYEFARLGQKLMQTVWEFPAPTYAAVAGYCMGGGLDLALACRRRVATPDAMFGHRGAALGLITGWGGTQRLPRLIGKSRAMAMFVAAEKVTSARGFEIGLVDRISEDPIAESVRQTLAAQQDQE